MKKYINQLSEKELLEVYFNNDTLQDLVVEDIKDRELDIVDEYIEHFSESLSEYEVNFGNTFINIDKKKVNDFIQGFEQLQNDHSFLNETDYEYVNELKKTNDLYRNTEMNTKEFEELSNTLSDKITDVEGVIQDCFENQLDDSLSRDYAVDYFREVYANESLSEEAFIQDDSFTLYEQRTYNFDDGGYVTGFDNELNHEDEMEM